MEKVKGFDQRAQMINELIRGMEVAKHLRNQILNPTNYTSKVDNQAYNNSLVDKMLTSIDKTISMAKLINIDEVNQQPLNSSNFQLEESTHDSLALSSPTSESSHQNLHVSKKRKMMPRWTKRVKISPGRTSSGLEGPLDDGYSWRKYGQKDILGAKFPRAYYRCTHRHSHDCQATKQVQISDDDVSIFQINYRGEHTCTLLDLKAQLKPIPAQVKTEPQPHSFSTPQPDVHMGLGPDDEEDLNIGPEEPKHEAYLGLGPDEEDLNVGPEEPKHEDYLGLGPDVNLGFTHEESKNKAQIFRTFSFTSALLEPEPVDNYFLSCSPAFGSPGTSESNHFPVSSYRITGAGIGLNVQTSESDINEGISGQNSVTNSPIMGEFEFPLNQLLDIDVDYPFDFCA